MKLIIIGNICTGKTTISKILAKQLKIDHVEIDEYRRKHNRARTELGEEVAKREFEKRMAGHGKAVVELTGSGRSFSPVLSIDRFVVMLTARKSTIRRRIRERLGGKYKLPPFPKSWGADFEGSKDAMYRFVDWAEDKIPREYADFVLDTDDFSIEEVCDDIIKEIKKRGIYGKIGKTRP